MQALQIAKDTLDDFPELIEKGYTKSDIGRIWASYEKEMNNFLFNPSKPYFKFLGLLYFGFDYFEIKNRVDNLLKFSDHTFLPDERIDYQILIQKVTQLQFLIEQKINHFEDVLKYLEGYDERNAPTSKKNINTRIGKWKDLYQKCNEIKDNYDKRIITRNLEKQNADS